MWRWSCFCRKKNIDFDENDIDWDGYMGKFYGIFGLVVDRLDRMF